MNPFKPTAGKMPPELIGRNGIIESFREGIENGPGAPERLMRITGARGMGKTVMLRELAKIAEQSGWCVVDEVANPGFCSRILERINPKGAVSSINIEPSIFGVSMGGIEVNRASLTLRDAISKKIEKSKNGLLITLDEVQDASIDEIRSLAVAIQQVIGDDLDVAFVFAGLSSTVDMVVNGKTLTFLRRAVPEELGSLDKSEIFNSYMETVNASNKHADDDVILQMAEASEGYPFMVQLVGYYAWQEAQRRGSDVIGGEDAEKGIRVAKSQFSRMVIEPALQHLSPSLICYLLAMAEDERDSVNTSDIARRLGKSVTGVSSFRSRLIKESIIEPSSRGKVRFTIPCMADYLNDHREDLLAEID